MSPDGAAPAALEVRPHAGGPPQLLEAEAAAEPVVGGEEPLEAIVLRIGLPGKSILGDYFQEKRTLGRRFLFLRISFPGRPIFMPLPPGKTDS